MAVGLDGTGIGVASELRNCQRIKMTTKTLYGRFPTRRIRKVTFVFDPCFLSSLSLFFFARFIMFAKPSLFMGSPFIPEVFFRAVDRLQIKFVDSLWSVAEVLF